MDRITSIPLAEIFNPEISSFEQQLEGQLQFIIWLYGAVFVIGLCLLIAFTLRIQDRPLSWTEPLRRLEWRPWNWPSAAWIALPLLTVQLIFTLLFILFGRIVETENGETERFLIILQSLLFHWTGFALIGWSLHRRKLSWSTAFGLRTKGFIRDACWGVVILLGVMPLILGYNIVAQMIMEWMGIAPEVQDVTRIISESSSVSTKIYFALLALAVAPVVEELIFRGILLPAITRMAGVKAAVIVVSVLFAAVHGHWPSFVPLFMLSAALCLAYIYRGSLITSMAMHSVFNSLTIAVILKM